MKRSIEVWKILDCRTSPKEEVVVGTFPKIKEYALKVFDNLNDKTYQRSYIENGDEIRIFGYLEENDFDVEHVCDVLIDEFNVKPKDYTIDI